MDFNELMKWKGYIYLEEIVEPEENSLRLLINRSKINNVTDTVEYLSMIQLDFETYVSYSVINEAFDHLDNNETSVGEMFRIYTKSNYLNFIQLATTERDDICASKNYIHYQFPCLDHIIDVISCDKPIITVVPI